MVTPRMELARAGGSPVKELASFGGMSDLRGAARVTMITGEALFLTGCTSATQEYLQNEGFNLNSVIPMPMVNDESVNKNDQIDNAKNINFTYAEKTDGSPYFIYEKNDGSGLMSYPVFRYNWTNEDEQITSVTIETSNETNPKNNDWQEKENIDKRLTLMAIEFEKPMSKETLDDWQFDENTTQAVNVKRTIIWDPLNSQGITHGHSSDNSEIAMLISPPIARPDAFQTTVPTQIVAIQTETPTPPAVDAKIKEVIGEKEYSELSASIGLNGEIKAVDYADYAVGNKFEGKIVSESIVVRETAAMLSPTIIVAEAEGPDGKIGVVWNPDTNRWVVATAINTNLMDKEHYTSFNNIDTMVENGDLDLAPLAQGLGSEPFPETTAKSQYWVNIKRSGIIANGKGILDYFLYLTNRPEDLTLIPGYDYEKGIMEGLYSKENKPYKYVAGVNGTTTDGKETVIIIKEIKNLDNTVIFEKIGLDPRLFNFLINDSADYKNPEEHPYGSMGEILMKDIFNIVPVFPLPLDVAPWDYRSTFGFGNGGNLYGMMFKGYSFHDDVTVAMQTPGKVFSQLPADIQKEIIGKMVIERIGEDNKKAPNYSFQLTEGISVVLAKAISRNIFVAGFHHGPLLQSITPTPSPTP